MTTPLNRLLKKPVTRKEFIAAIGGSLLSILGASTIIPTIGNKADNLATAKKGYGSGTFHGPKPT